MITLHSSITVHDNCDGNVECHENHHEHKWKEEQRRLYKRCKRGPHVYARHRLCEVTFLSTSLRPSNLTHQYLHTFAYAIPPSIVHTHYSPHMDLPQRA